MLEMWVHSTRRRSTVLQAREQGQARSEWFELAARLSQAQPSSSDVRDALRSAKEQVRDAMRTSVAHKFLPTHASAQQCAAVTCSPLRSQMRLACTQEGEQIDS